MLLAQAAGMIGELLKRPVRAETEGSSSTEHGSQDSLDVDMTELVRLRRRYQTRQAESGVRNRKSKEPRAVGDDRQQLDEQARSTRREMLVKLHDALKGDRNHRGLCSGLERLARWRAQQDNETTHGNVANAEQAAKARASKVSLSFEDTTHYVHLLTYCEHRPSNADGRSIRRPYQTVSMTCKRVECRPFHHL